MAVGTQTVVKWIAAGVVAAIVASLALFSGFGTPLITGLVLAAIGVAILMFVGTKQLGVATAIPAGFIVASGIILTQEFIVPIIPVGVKTA